MKILAVSDIALPQFYQAQLKTRFPDLGVLISCGDLPHEYIEFLVSSLDIPFYYVLGNHDQVFHHDSFYHSQNIAGGTNLHTQSVISNGTIFAGIEGSLRYRDGPYQYSQSEMWAHIFQLIPKLLINRVRYGRYLDVFVTHAPGAGIHDKQDLPHQGIYAFRWFIEKYKPRYHIHGHVHVYRPDETVLTVYRNTTVINAYGFKIIDIP